MSLTVLAVVQSGLGYSGYVNLRDQYDQQNAEDFAKCRAMLNALFENASHDASEQARAIAAVASIDELPWVGELFFKFTAVRYYDERAQLLAEWRLAGSPRDSEGTEPERLAVAEVSRTATPQLYVECRDSCLLRVVLQAFERGGRKVVVAAAYPLQGALREFHSVTRADVALMIPVAPGEGPGTLWGRRLVASPESERLQPVLADVTDPPPAGTDARLFRAGGRALMVALQPIPITAAGPVETLILVDETDRLASIAVNVGDYTMLTLLGLVLATASIFILLTPSLRRLGQITEGLPLLAVQRFDEAKKLFARAARRGAGDEIDRLNRSAVTLANHLQRLMGVEAASEAKSQFLAAMSHEIRTPINGLLGLLELHEGTDLSDAQRETVRIMRDSALTLLAVIDDILDFSKMEAGQLRVDPVPTSLRDTVEGAVETLAASAGSKGLCLVCYVQPGLPAKVRVDPVRLRQVLLNLCSNAIKFTERGKVVIALEAARADTDPLRIRCTVRDTGIGVPPEARGRMFKAFHQAEVSISRRYGGTGLGLSISHGLVIRMGGTMGFSSVVGAGSTFWFEIDCPVAEPAAPLQVTLDGITVRLDIADTDERLKLQHYLGSAGAKVVGDGADWQVRVEEHEHTGLRLTATSGAHHMIGRPVRYLQLIREIAHLCGVASGARPGEQRQVAGPVPSAGGRVLVAEDHPTNRHVIRQQLERLGYAADIVEDGRQALERLAQGAYRVLVTDLHMPGMDGLALTEEIRRREAAGGAPPLPIIGLTADVLPDAVERCRKAGMNDVLRKPATIADLGRSLARWAPQAEEKRPAIDRNILARLMGTDDAAALASVLADFVRVSTGLIADLQRAVAGRNVERVLEIAHRMKGSAQTVGAVDLGAASVALERAAQQGQLAEMTALQRALDLEFERVRAEVPAEGSAPA